MGLRSKFIIALLAVALIPLIAIEWMNLRALGQQLAAERRGVLEEAASDTAAAVDAFIQSSLDAVRMEAQLPTVVEYLQVGADQRGDPDVQRKAMALLRALTLRDRVQISSYAVLDLSGDTLLDTWGANLGRDRSDWSFFQAVRESRLPHVSPVLFDDDASTDTSASREVGIYFTSPVRDPLGAIIGFLVCRYRVSILQRLITRQDGLAGPRSYASLIDEHGLILADSGAPERVLTFARAPAPAVLAHLRRARRVPLEFEPAKVVPTRASQPGERAADPRVARHELDTRPWQVQFRATDDDYRLLARRQARQTLLAGLALVVILIALAWLLAGVLTRPITRMIQTAETIAQGHYDTRVEVSSHDELGDLASALNTMTERLADLIATLEERVAERTSELARQLDLSRAAVQSAEDAKRQLHDTNVELTRSNRELDDFAYIASHDLKEPLRGIHNYAGFLLEDYGDELDKDGRSKLQTMARLSQRMEALINNLLQFSRVGRIDLAIEQTDLGAIVQDVLDSLHITIQERDIDIRIPAPLPTVRCDRARVGEIFRNLLTNAIKFNDKPARWIEIGFTPATAPVELYVRDNGIGIRAKHLDKIFGIFKRLHGRDKYGGGTGAGLTIAQKIVHRHGGTLRVESVYGEGTAFYFTLDTASGGQS